MVNSNENWLEGEEDFNLKIFFSLFYLFLSTLTLLISGCAKNSLTPQEWYDLVRELDNARINSELQKYPSQEENEFRFFLEKWMEENIHKSDKQTEKEIAEYLDSMGWIEFKYLSPDNHRIHSFKDNFDYNSVGTIYPEEITSKNYLEIDGLWDLSKFNMLVIRLNAELPEAINISFLTEEIYSPENTIAFTPINDHQWRVYYFFFDEIRYRNFRNKLAKKIRISPFNCKIDYLRLIHIPEEKIREFRLGQLHHLFPNEYFKYLLNPNPLRKKILIGDYYRDSILMLPNTEIEFNVSLSATAELKFYLALLQTSWLNEDETITFRVSVKKNKAAMEALNLKIDRSNLDQFASFRECIVPLGMAKGHKVSIKFSLTSDIASQSPEKTSLAYLVIGNPIIVNEEQAEEEKKKNLFLICLDTLRADHLGSYGYPKETSPNLDRFAKESIQFFQMIAPSYWTLPCHMSLFTSSYVYEHKVYADNSARLDNSFITMAEILKSAGYYTAAYTDGAAMDGSKGFEKGFNVYYQSSSPFLKNVDQDVELWIKELDDIKIRPFFLFLHTYEIHDPYMPPWPYNVAMSRGYFRQVRTVNHLAKILDSEGDPEKIKREYANSILNFIDSYDGNIKRTDDFLGVLFNYLIEKGLWDKSIIAIMSDHGEEFLDHSNLKHNSLYDEILHIPFLLHIPQPSFPRKNIQEQVRMIDILPTFIDLLDIKAPCQFSGVSLMKLLNSHNPLPDLIAIAEKPQEKRTEQVAIRNSDKKLFYWFFGYKPVLFNLSYDPAEKVNSWNEQEARSLNYNKHLSEIYPNLINPLYVRVSGLKEKDKISGTITTNPPFITIANHPVYPMSNLSADSSFRNLLFEHNSSIIGEFMIEILPAMSFEFDIKINGKEMPLNSIFLGLNSHPQNSNFYLNPSSEDLVLSEKEVKDYDQKEKPLLVIYRSTHKYAERKVLDPEILRQFKALGYIK